MKIHTSALTPSQLDTISPEVGFQPQANIWVNLRDRLSPYSFDQAFLLCEVEDGAWIAWVPDFGQAILGRHQFYGLDA
jgi:hypothetical protein